MRLASSQRIHIFRSHQEAVRTTGFSSGCSTSAFHKMTNEVHLLHASVPLHSSGSKRPRTSKKQQQNRGVPLWSPKDYFSIIRNRKVSRGEVGNEMPAWEWGQGAAAHTMWGSSDCWIHKKSGSGKQRKHNVDFQAFLTIWEVYIGCSHCQMCISSLIRWDASRHGFLSVGGELEVRKLGWLKDCLCSL